MKIPHRPNLNFDTDLRSEFENLDVSIANDSYSDLYSNYLNYINAHGLSFENDDAGELIQFPHFEKTQDAQVRQKIYGDIYSFIKDTQANTKRLDVEVQQLSTSRSSLMAENRRLLELNNGPAGRIAQALRTVARRMPKVASLVKKAFE